MNVVLPKHTHCGGFALVVTISLLILLTVIAVALLGLSAISMRSAGINNAQAIARSNARLALMIAIGELQKEMGPDMRISSESALLDTDPNTETMEGLARSHWLGSYNSWGDWLNNTYTPPDTSSPLKIADTYTKGRERMFRRWLLSLPSGVEKNLQAPVSPGDSNNTDWVALIDTGSLGASASPNPDRVTRAYKTQVGTSGRFAWWIGPENHKAKITLTGQPRTLAAAQWEQSQGETGEVGVGSLTGYTALDAKSNLGKSLITTNSLRLVPVDKDRVDESFFDVTASSQGVIASVRGTFKKDLSLLFEMDNSKLPALYQYVSGSVREPSIRPMSQDLLSKNPVRPNRHFASWTNMRHYYRMYRNTSDATTGTVETNGAATLNWSGAKPYTGCVSTVNAGTTTVAWEGDNNYKRMPILAKATFIYSLLALPSATYPNKSELYHVYSPVFTYWNPYNVELRVPDNAIAMLTSAYKLMPNTGELYLGNTLYQGLDDLGGSNGALGYGGTVVFSHLRSGNGGDIVFRPGEFRVFSHTVNSLGQNTHVDFMPGFDPQAVSGERKRWGKTIKVNGGSEIETFDVQIQRPGMALTFCASFWGGNVNLGNTCGAFALPSFWGSRVTNQNGFIPMAYSNDWFQRLPGTSKDQTRTRITGDPQPVNNIAQKPSLILPWIADGKPYPVAYTQLVFKGVSKPTYDSITWAKDWRSRNWLQAPPFYFGSGMYMSLDDQTAHTQRLDCPYMLCFGSTGMGEIGKVVGAVGVNSYLGSGSNPYEQVTSAPVLELPTAPLSNIASFSNMRINPGWVKLKDGDSTTLYPDLQIKSFSGNGYTAKEASKFCDEVKAVSYQSGITGPGIGNSFIHPMLPRTDVYTALDNSKSQDTPNRTDWKTVETVETNAFNDYWDHVFLLNDALWDDYFVSSLADQTRQSSTGAITGALSLSQNLDQLVAGNDLSNIRYRYYSGGKSTAAVKTELQATTGYLKAAKYLMTDGMFNVNSTSVAAWQALFAGIRERQLVYRDSTGALKTISVPSGKRIAISRFDTETSDQEMTDPAIGATTPDGLQGWTGVRYLDDNQLLTLAQECVKQVKQRGPFLNFSEFINRRLSNDKLGLMGALQSAIDYDDDSPSTNSINYKFKKNPGLVIKPSDLGATSFGTPEAVNGSRLAGIPGYVIQSDLLKPIANTLGVRDDTFRIRTYGQANDASGNITATAYCEAILQRMPEYCDPTNDPDVPARLLDSAGVFSDNRALTAQNGRFGRKFQFISFRWLSKKEI